MHPGYEDIIAAAGRDPDWWGEGGVPRFAPFNPRMLGVYDKSAIYGLLGCQGCERTFPVAIGRPVYDLWDYTGPEEDIKPWDAKRIRDEFNYGDAPRHNYLDQDSGCAGTTMGTWLVEVLEAWEHRKKPDGEVFQQHFGEWTRVPELEGPVADE